MYSLPSGGGFVASGKGGQLLLSILRHKKRGPRNVTDGGGASPLPWSGALAFESGDGESVRPMEIGGAADPTAAGEDSEGSRRLQDVTMDTAIVKTAPPMTTTPYVRGPIASVCLKFASRSRPGRLGTSSPLFEIAAEKKDRRPRMVLAQLQPVRCLIPPPADNTSS